MRGMPFSANVGEPAAVTFGAGIAWQLSSIRALKASAKPLRSCWIISPPPTGVLSDLKERLFVWC
jgi:hypothetical protein